MDWPLLYIIIIEHFADYFFRDATLKYLTAAHSLGILTRSYRKLSTAYQKIGSNRFKTNDAI